MNDSVTTPSDVFTNILRFQMPDAIAWINGGSMFPAVSGSVRFYATPYNGVLIMAQLFNLPNQSTPGSSDYYAMHIHEYGDCSHDFVNTGGHFNPTGALHPNHAGDMLPLMANAGYAWLAFYDKRFTIPEILGRSVIIHRQADDFTTQPSGNSGAKIACGVVHSSTESMSMPARP